MAIVIIDRATLDARANALSDDELAALGLGRPMRHDDLLILIIDPVAHLAPVSAPPSKPVVPPVSPPKPIASMRKTSLEKPRRAPGKRSKHATTQR